MTKFMGGDTILVLGHVYGRLLTFRIRDVLCISVMNGVSVGETLSKCSDNRCPTDGSTTQTTDGFTSCRALGHTPEAA